MERIRHYTRSVDRSGVFTNGEDPWRDHFLVNNTWLWFYRLESWQNNSWVRLPVPEGWDSREIIYSKSRTRSGRGPRSRRTRSLRHIQIEVEKRLLHISDQAFWTKRRRRRETRERERKQGPAVGRLEKPDHQLSSHLTQLLSSTPQLQYSLNHSSQIRISSVVKTVSKSQNFRMFFLPDLTIDEMSIKNCRLTISSLFPNRAFTMYRNLGFSRVTSYLIE